MRSAPGYVAPVVRKAADGERELVNLNWGFILLQTDRAPRRVTNVRDDKILTSKFCRRSFEQRRCLVPASPIASPRREAGHLALVRHRRRRYTARVCLARRMDAL